MCGIFALLNVYNNHFISRDDVMQEFQKGRNRGPEFSKLDENYIKLTLGFHRLAINGLNEQSNQPLKIDDIVLICNGEIYNYKELYKLMNIVPTTGSDCEVIIHLYKKYGIEQTLLMLDGVFSFILLDNRITDSICNNVYIARDPYGVRPLYYLKNSAHNVYGFASELKCLNAFDNNANNAESNIHQFTPGTYYIFQLSGKVQSTWEPVKENIPYFVPSFPHQFSTISIKMEHYTNSIAKYLDSAVRKRCLTTERPIACLLSGGLDSSLITALVNNFYKTSNIVQQLETYSIGLEGSEDLKNARIVSNYLGTNHTEILVTEDDMFNAIPDVIYNIESYDTTTVRASIGNYLLGKYISTHSEAKVIFNGDGSDELCGGYLYMNSCPDAIEFDKETRRLLKDIHLYDVLRSDKCISSHGLEPRTPFLDKNFVNYYLSIPPGERFHKLDKKCEKYLLRNSFSIEHFKDFEGKQLLPDEILWRRKEAFSDGVSCHGRSLYTILQEKIAAFWQQKMDKPFPITIETEKMYYKTLFEEFYPNHSSIVPYYWMPKYTNATDPSARTLAIYNNTSA